MMQESVLRPIVNSLLWARKNQDADAVQNMIQQCIQYLEQMECTDTALYEHLRTGALPSSQATAGRGVPRRNRPDATAMPLPALLDICERGGYGAA